MAVALGVFRYHWPLAGPLELELATNSGSWRGLDDLEVATCAWVSWFNEERLHSELGDRTPAEAEDDYRQRSQPDVA